MCVQYRRGTCYFVFELRVRGGALVPGAGWCPACKVLHCGDGVCIRERRGTVGDGSSTYYLLTGRSQAGNFFRRFLRATR